MVNVGMILYIIGAVLVGVFGLMYFLRTSQTIAAILFFVGALIVLILFGIRWFGPGAEFNSAPGSWPPYVNTCPDYLTYYKRKKSNGDTSDTCVDTIGVATGGMLKVFPKDGDVNVDNDDYFFNLKTASADSGQSRAELCQRTIQYGLTWEGVTDGESCMSSDGKVITPAASSGTTCTA